MYKRSKSQRITPKTLYIPHHYPPFPLTSHQHFSDYFALTDKTSRPRPQQKTEQNQKIKKDSQHCIAIGSAPDHDRAIVKMQENIAELNRQQITILRENQKIKDEIQYCMIHLCQARNQREQQLINELKQKTQKVKLLMKTLQESNEHPIEQSKTKNEKLKRQKRSKQKSSSKNNTNGKFGKK